MRLSLTALCLNGADASSVWSQVLPTQVPGFLLEALDDEIILCNPTNDLIICCNVTAALIWQLCDGRRLLGEIIAILCAAYPGAEVSIVDQVTTVVRMLCSRGALVCT